MSSKLWVLKVIFGVCKNEKLNIMINSDGVTGENRQEHNPWWAQIPDHLYRILIVGSPESRKANALLNLNSPPYIDKIFLNAKDPYKSKYLYLIKSVKSWV